MAREREAQQSPGWVSPCGWRLLAQGICAETSLYWARGPLCSGPLIWGYISENSSVAGGHSAGPQPGWDPYGQLGARAQTHFLTHERGRACPCLPRCFELVPKIYQITLIIIQV